jgi:hypothetical protein
MPQVGQQVVIAFLAERVPGTVEAVDPDARQLKVVTDHGDVLTFRLNTASGRFISIDPSRAKLYFEGP